MRNYIYRLLQKLSSYVKPEEATYPNVSSLDKTTIFPQGFKLRFDTGNDNRKYVEIGQNGIINAQFIFETRQGYINIGNNVHIGGATFICRTGITIGNDVTMAWGITLYDHNSHSIYWEHRKHDNAQSYQDYKDYNGNNVVNKNWDQVITAPITIADKVWIGFDVTILKGVNIGEGAVVGAKSVVTKDVPAWTVVAGNPAKFIKNVS